MPPRDRPPAAIRSGSTRPSSSSPAVADRRSTRVDHRRDVSRLVVHVLDGRSVVGEEVGTREGRCRHDVAVGGEVGAEVGGLLLPGCETMAVDDEGARPAAHLARGVPDRDRELPIVPDVLVPDLLDVMRTFSRQRREVVGGLHVPVAAETFRGLAGLDRCRGPGERSRGLGRRGDLRAGDREDDERPDDETVHHALPPPAPARGAGPTDVQSSLDFSPGFVARASRVREM